MSDSSVTPESEQSQQFQLSPVLLEKPAEDLARAALAEITSEDDIGDLVSRESVAENIVELKFASKKDGYPNWLWTASVTSVGDVITVLEVELLPGEDALLAPEWVPWDERLAEYKQELAEEQEDDEDEEDILDVHFDHELRGELPQQLEDIVDDLDDPDE